MEEDVVRLVSVAKYDKGIIAEYLLFFMILFFETLVFLTDLL